MKDRIEHQRMFTDSAECLRALAEVRANDEVLAVKLLTLSRRLDETGGAGMTFQFSASERALLMEALSAMAPLIDHANVLDAGSRGRAERQRCAGSLEALVQLVTRPPS